MIVVSGEALMDVYDAGTTATGVTLDARIGGSPFNVALGLARLGRPVVFFGALSKGFLGDRLNDALTREGVDTSPSPRVDARTTLALVGLDADGVPDYAFYGENAADRRLTIADLAAVPVAAAYHFGSYTMVTEPTGPTLIELAGRKHGEALVTWDPNVRTNVEPNLDRWRALFEAMIPRIHVLKVSDEDLGLLYPGVDPADHAARWLAAGISLVIVTRGGSGVSAWTAAGRIDRPSFAVSVVDTVGAGDTFQAALLAWLEEQGRLSIVGVRDLPLATLEEMLRFAAAAAAITCSRRGADLPRRAEVDAFLVGR